jgi:hypothetical protein
MKNPLLALALSAGLSLAACATPTPSQTIQVVNVYLTSAANPWMNNVYDCAPAGMVVNLTDPDSAQLTFRIGEPDHLTTPAFQLSTEDVLVVTNLNVGVDSLNADQVRSLFLGQVTNWKELGGNDVPVQVWTYSPDEDIQRIFEQDVMNGQTATSQARLAVSVEAMTNSIETVPGSIGVVTRRWKSGNTLEVFSLATVPVLAITSSQPEGAVKALLACLQKGN